MKRKVSRLRLSPNEEARLIREELERRRKLRIQQVREQQREISLQIRREVERRRQHELRRLEEQLRDDWERGQREKLHALQSLYQESLQLLGQSHRRAKENEPDPAAVAQREEEHHAKAEQRYREALKELKVQRSKEQERQKQSINARKKALQTEKERSAKVASLPPPLPDPIQAFDPRTPHVVKRADQSAFAATRYHIPGDAVESELETQQPDAREEAAREVRRLQELQTEDQRRREEQLERARLRGRKALRRELLLQDRERWLVELEHMQQTDLLRKRQQVSQIPPQIFQPLYKRQETRDDFQREMEFAFEDMYTGERRVKGDLVVQLVPEPLPAPSTGGQDPDLDPELDVTVDENADPEAGSVQNDSEDVVESSEPAAEVEALRPPARRALRKLLDRIRSQRNDWINGSSHVPAHDSPTVFTDQIPERDTTIETGSLTNDMDKQSAVELGELAVPPTTPGPTGPPSVEESPLPSGFLSRIQEAGEERKKMEFELEMEKQISLLVELEQQKAGLEQMLWEAQHEREELKAAASQEALLLHPQVSAQDYVPTSLKSETDSSCSVREYQRRLLEQNRTHQRSVEVARQRLEEYQRALRIRHSLKPPAAPDAHNAQMRGFSASPPADPPFTIDLSSPGPDVAARLTDSILERVTKHLPERLRPSPVAAEPLRPPTSDSGSSASRQIPDPDDSHRRRRELQEAERRLVEQRAALALQEKLREEERRRAEEELQRMRRQKEALQALMVADEQRVSDVHRTRLQLLASLLRAIEESNGGTLSHLEEHEEGEGGAPLVPSVVPAGPPEPSWLLHPPRTQKPPVTRVRLGFKEMMPEQHELSAIQEVETTADASRLTAGDDLDPSSPPAWFETSDRILPSPSVSSRGRFSDENRVSSDASSFPWRERLLSGAGASPESSESDSFMKLNSPLCSDSGRGADSPGAAAPSSTSPSEPLRRPAESDCFSSTTISSGSYVSTDPEQNVNADELRPLKETGSGTGVGSSPCVAEESSASSPAGRSVESLFNDGSIQRIIDKYTRELNVSLGAAGTTTDSEGPSLEESSSSVSQQPLVGEDETSAGAQSHTREGTSPGHPSSERFCPGDLSLSLDPERDSFRPLSFQLSDQSSCLAPEDRHSVLEQLVGQPSAQSSMIGPQPGLTSDPGGWDFTLSRMIDRLSQQSGSRWLSPAHDFSTRLLGSEASWLDESRMRPLVGEPDDSADQHAGNSGATETRRLCSGQSPAESEEPAPLPDDAATGGTDEPDQILQHQAGLVELDSYRAEESFHQLLPEITHNQTADPSLTFRLHQHLDRSHDGASWEDDASPEQLREEEPDRCEAVRDSFSRLEISDRVPPESVLLLSTSLKTDSCVPADAPSSLEPGRFTELKDSDPVGEHRDEEIQQLSSAWENELEAGREVGILEQSQITLVSLTDSTVQDLMTTDDEALQDGREAVETEMAETTLVPEETPAEDGLTLPASFLAVRCSPSRDVLQQKRQALIQRSNRRVQQIKAKRSVGKKEADGRVPAGRVQSVACLQRNQQTTDGREGWTPEKKLRPPAAGNGSTLKIPDEVQTCDPERRRRNVSEMRRRTQRLFEQLDEVKQQRVVRSHQEDRAKNRLKAAEFHRKTLQKLRAKQTSR